MSGAGTIAPGEVGTEAAAALREITDRAVGGRPVAVYAEADPLPWAAVRDGGWDLLGAPVEAGGAGASLRDLVEVARAWGRAVVPSPLVPTLLAKRWSSAARAHPGPVTFSVPSPDAVGSGAAPFGGAGDVRLLLATSDDGALGTPPTGVVDGFAPTLRTVRGLPTATWSADAAREVRVVWAAEATGCADRMLAASVAYAQAREQFGRPIGSFQAVKHALADAHLLTEQAETAVILAALDPDRAAAAASFAFEASMTVVETAVQVHGGLGFTWEMGLHVHLRHVAALRELAAGLPT